jgi:hypothetical protein
LDFIPSQPAKVGQPEAVVSTYPIHFRELDLSAFVLLSSALELTAEESPVALKVLQYAYLGKHSIKRFSYSQQISNGYWVICPPN